MGHYGQRRLTFRQARYLRAIAEGKTQQAAVVAAGYSPTANGNPMKGRFLRSRLETLMDKQGLSEAKLLTPIASALDANRVGVVGKMLVETGIPDHQTRLDAAELGWKLRGKLSPSAHAEGARSITIIYGHQVAVVPEKKE